MWIVFSVVSLFIYLQVVNATEYKRTAVVAAVVVVVAAAMSGESCFMTNWQP